MLIPATRYADPEAALAFMVDVLGLEARAVFRDDAGGIVPAEMWLGDGVTMVGPEATGGPFDAAMISPAGACGRETTTIYAVVRDVAQRHARALLAGADFLLPLAAQDHGGVAFTLRDREVHVWTLGDYVPSASGSP